MLNKILLISFVFSSTAYGSDQVELYGFGKSSQELVADGYRSTIKSNGNQIFDKKTPTSYYKIVSKKNESVSRLYREGSSLYMQYTKLDDQGKVLGQVQCKYSPTAKVTSCDGQTAGLCKELISKVDAGAFDFDLKKIKECAEISSKINYSRAGADELVDEGAKKLAITNGGAIPQVVKSTPSSLQTLMKDYTACKKIEAELSEQADKTAMKSSAADPHNGTQ